MSSEIDSLQIGINASAKKAMPQIDTLINKLGDLNSALFSLNASGLNSLAKGVTQLGSSMKSLKENVSSRDFSNFAKNLNKISAVNINNFSALANAMVSVGNGAEKFNVSTRALDNFSSSIKALGGNSVSKAVSNIPLLSAEIEKMMTALSKTPVVSQNVIQMTNALASLAAQGAKVGTAAKTLGAAMNVTASGTNNASKATGSITSRLKNMNISMGKSIKNTRSLSSLFGKFYASCFLMIRGIKALGRSIESSMDYIETYNYFNVITDKIGAEFGNAWRENGYSSAEEYSKSFRERLNNLTSQMTGYAIGAEGGLYLSDNVGLGLDPEKIMAYQANISSITNAVGLMGETSVNTSKALTMLAADLSSLKNQDLESVMKNLQSGLIGQSRALYKYGIDITNNTLQTYAYANGIDKAVQEMTQAEKMQLRLLAILDQSKVAYGDMANTISGVANQFRIFKQQVSNLARIIGNLFIPVLQTVLPYINGFIIALQRLFTWIGNLLGVKWENLMDGISSGYTDTGLEELYDNAEDVTGALEDANKAANKLKKTIHSYDELHVASDPNGGNENTSIGGSGGIDLSGAIADALADYEKVWNEALARMENKAQEIADKICDIFKNHDFRAVGEYIGNGITNALDSIDWEKVYAVANSFGSGLAEFFNGLISPELFGAVGKTIAGALNTAIYVALSFATTFDWTNLGLSIASGVNTFFETFDFAALAQAINAWVQGLFKALTTAIANIDWSNVWNGIKTFFANLEIETVGIIIGALVIKKILGLHLVSAALDMIGSAISKSLAGAIGKKLGLDLAKDAGLGAAFSGIGKQMGTVFGAGFKALFGSKAAESALAFMNPVVKGITGIGSIIGGAALSVTNFFAMWENGFNWLNEALMVVGAAIAAVGAVILGVPAGIAAIVAAIVAAVATAVIVIHDNWDAICEWFSGLPEWFNTNVITPVCNFFRGLWESVSGFFSGLWEDISAIWSTVSEWFSVNVIEPAVGFFEGFSTRVQQIFEGLWIIVQAVWKTVAEWFDTNVIIPICDFFQDMWDSVSGFFSSLWEDICKLWSKVSDWFKQNVITPVCDFFEGLWENVSRFFANLWEDIKAIWSKVSDWFNTTVITPVVNAFTTFKDTVVGIFDKIWTSLKSGVVSAMNSLIGAVESAINWIIGGINKVIAGFNKIVSWAAQIIGVQWGGVSLVQTVSLNRISMYESGGFPNMGEMFLARENGIPEMVGRIGNRTSVVNNEQIVESVARGVESAVTSGMMNVFMATQGNTNTDDNREVHVHVHIGNDELGVATFKGLKDAARRGLIPKFV